MEIMELMKFLFAKKAIDVSISLIIGFIGILFILCARWMERNCRKNGQIRSKSYRKTDKQEQRMKAEEMFEKLGYKKETKETYICFSKNIGNLCIAEKIVLFDLNSQSVVYPLDGSWGMLDMQLLKIINKQCKELGWLDEQ